MAYEIPRITGVHKVTNAVEEAIHDVLGGPIKAAQRMGITRQGCYYLLASPWVRDRRTALRLEELTGIPAAELMALVPWRGPERAAKRHGTLTDRDRRTKARARAKSTLSNSHAVAAA